jgi:hypothetical protein
MKYFIAVLLVLVSTMAYAGSVTFQWDAYTEANDGFYLYQANTTGVQPILANRVATITPKTATTYTLTNVSVGSHFWCLTAYSATLGESVCSNEATGIVKLGKPTGLIITITQ